MMRTLLRTCLVFVLLACAQAASAITCTSISSPGVSMNYTNNTIATTQSSFTVSCTRNAGDPATSVTYSVTADNGTNPQGQNNRATLGAATLRYDVYTNSSCGTQWKGNTAISDTISWTGGATGTISRTSNYWGCVTTAQTAASSGAYLDTVGLTLAYTGGASITTTLPVSIYAPALCTVTTAPGTIAMTYVPMGPQVQKSTTFAVRCTTGMPYTVSTNVPEGVILNLRYLLAVSPASGNGTGAPQTVTITATLPANQADSCPAAGGCTQSAAHTVTVTY